MSGPNVLLRGALALVLCASVAAGAWSWRRAAQAERREVERDGEIAALRAALAEEAALRGSLEAEVARLRAAVEAALEPAPAEPSAPDAAAPSDEEKSDAETAASLPQGDAPHTVAATVVDVDRLAAAGFRRDDVLRLRERVDAIDLARLDLHDRAMREGWAGTPRFSAENRALNEAWQGLRDEFGDELYDWLLYSTGQPNRVAIGDVLAGSAAEAAGLARGDVIVRYDDRLVLSASELRNATFAGRAGEWVAIEVLREGDDRPRRYFVPRGPIGVRLAPVTVEPSRPG